MADLLAPYKVMVEEALEEHPFKGPAPLVEAMRYSLLGGGKRLRGVLTLLFAQAVGGKAADALPLAKALEMVHAYSLIHSPHGGLCLPERTEGPGPGRYGRSAG